MKDSATQLLIKYKSGALATQFEMTRVLTVVCRYYPQIDVCQSEKDGDIAAKKKELELAAEEDFGNSRVHICVNLLISELDSF